jgi:hypothetical protein
VRCPFCAETIKEGAIVCGFCQRDLSFVLPLERQLRAQSKQIDALRAEVVALRDLIATQPAAAPEPPPAPVAPRATVLFALEAFLVPFALVMATHYVVLGLLDADLAYANVASGLIPALWTAARPVQTRLGWPWTLALSWLLGVSAVFAISALFFFIGDSEAIMPRDPAEWVEFAQYAGSVALGFITGALARRVLVPPVRARPRPVPVLLAIPMEGEDDAAGTALGSKAPADAFDRAGRFLDAMEKGADEIQKDVSRITKIVEVATPMVTAVVSAVAAWRAAGH